MPRAQLRKYFARNSLILPINYAAPSRRRPKVHPIPKPFNHSNPTSTKECGDSFHTNNMSPTTPRRVGDKPNSASPSTISTPRLKVQPQRSYSDHWWIEQQRQQPQISGGFYTLLAPETSLHATEPMEFKAQNCHNSPSSSPTGVPRRGQSVVSATSSDRNRYSDHAFTIDKIGNTTAPGPNSPIFQDNHASASEHGSDQENQSPANFPSTPPNEHTSRRLQRDPLQQLALDGHGQPIHTTASRPANLFSHPGFALATSSDVDEDAYLDTDSNTPTIVLSATRKRGAGHLEEEDDDDNDGNDGPRDESPRAAMLKRLKTSHGSTEVDSLAGTKVRKTQQEQESNHITSASKRSMGSRHHLVPATGQCKFIYDYNIFAYELTREQFVQSKPVLQSRNGTVSPRQERFT
jgi:hypothetical protein